MTSASESDGPRILPGRKPGSSLFVLGETAADRGERIRRVVAAEVAKMLGPASVDAQSETAQQRFRLFLRVEFAPALRKLGFKGSGNQFTVTRGDYLGWFGFQKSVHNTKALVEFTVNWSVRYVPADQSLWGGRIGHLLPVHQDLWWRLPAGEDDTTGLLEDLLSSFRDFGLVAVEATSDSGEISRDGPGPWTRTFDKPVPRPFVPQMRGAGFPQEPLTVDRAAETASLPSDPGRYAAIRALYELAPHDPRFISVLLSCLETEPNSGMRAQAAMMLAFVPVDPGMIVADLQAAVAADPEIAVRMSARYALKELNHRIRGGAP